MTPRCHGHGSRGCGCGVRNLYPRLHRDPLLRVRGLTTVYECYMSAYHHLFKQFHDHFLDFFSTLCIDCTLAAHVTYSSLGHASSLLSLTAFHSLVSSFSISSRFYGPLRKAPSCSASMPMLSFPPPPVAKSRPKSTQQRRVDSLSASVDPHQPRSTPPLISPSPATRQAASPQTHLPLLQALIVTGIPLSPISVNIDQEEGNKDYIK
jgi:hypothetical protein